MSREDRTVREGLLLGGFAYAAVAVFYAAFDFLAARGPFFTVDLLGKALFRGLRDPAVLQLPARIDMVATFFYNALHLGVSLAIGLVIAYLLTRAERSPGSARMSLAVIVAGFFITVAVVGVLTASFRPLLPWWSIVGANAAAVCVAGGILIWRRPKVLTVILGRAGQGEARPTG